MATYHEDGTNDYVPGESNDRAVPAPQTADAKAPEGEKKPEHNEHAAHGKAHK